MACFVSHMTWDELDSKAKSTGVALIPAGSTERHGRHLPMKTDSATGATFVVSGKTRTKGKEIKSSFDLIYNEARVKHRFDPIIW